MFNTPIIETISLSCPATTVDKPSRTHQKHPAANVAFSVVIFRVELCKWRVKRESRDEKAMVEEKKKSNSLWTGEYL